MGLLVNGKWVDQWYDTDSTGGKFKRDESQFRNWITADGSPGPTGKGGFPAASQRYILYVCLACPWAHRTLIMRELKGLQEHIAVVVVSPLMGENGWTFAPGDGVDTDPVLKADFLYQLYQKADPNYTGRVTVPMLWDSMQQTIVSNESADILRMFNSAFAAMQQSAYDYYPAALRESIDEINDYVYHNINNGVYKAGFATTQDAYNEAVYALFDALDTVEERLQSQRYLCGDQITEADWRLFTTLVRFDAVYAGHFKCNLRRIVDYPALWGYLRDLYQHNGIASTVNMSHIKRHYYSSHPSINPTGIVPAGPKIDFTLPHQRDQLNK
ncbi:MAG TPA: glutathione S-transferase family protein [Alcaligenaceae bacterium]|nr:glutathione S-transferase family protein [Alcaligenaceae bacterium]